MKPPNRTRALSRLRWHTPTQEELDRARSRLDAAIAEETIRLGPHTGDETITILEPVPPRKAGAIMRRLLTSEAVWSTTVVVAALVLAAVLFTPPPPENPVTSPPATNPPGVEDPVQTVPPTVNPPDVEVAWTTVATEDHPRIEHIGDSVMRFIGPEVSTSRDGLNWELRGNIEPFAHVEEIVADGQILVALGWVGEPLGDREYVSWVSSNSGRTWQRNNLDRTRVRGIAATPIGFVAVGSTIEIADGWRRSSHGTVWISSDGRRWEQTVVLEDEERTSSAFISVIWSDGLKLLGRRGPTAVNDESLDQPFPGDDQMRVWNSPDGRSVDGPADTNFKGFLRDTITTPHGAIMSDWYLPGAWQTTDYTTWAPLPVRDETWVFAGVAVEGDHITLIAHKHFEDPSGGWTETEIWHSFNGASWNRVSLPDLPENAWLDQLVVVGDTVVVTWVNLLSETGLAVGQIRQD